MQADVMGAKRRGIGAVSSLALYTGALCFGIMNIGGSAVLAQAADEAPPRLTFDLSSSLTHDDNPGLSPAGSAAETTLDNRFGLTLNTATRSTSLSFSLQGLARVSSDEALSLRDPSAALSYNQDSANSRISVNGLFRQSPVDLFEPVVAADGTVSTTDILASTGTITTKTAGFSFATGLQAPLGFDISANTSGRSYSDTTDPAVFDSTSTNVKAGLRVSLGSERDARLSLGRATNDYDNVLQSLQEKTSFSLGYSQIVRSGLSVQAALGQTDATFRQLGVLVSQSQGLTGSLGLDLEMPNGTASVSLSSERDALGTRQSLSFGRNLDLSSGALKATAGFTARAGGTLHLVGTLSYALDLPSDNFGVDVSRQVTTNADNQDVVNTTLGLKYSHKLSDAADIGVSLNLLSTDGAGGATATRQTLRTTYSRDLVADWKLSAGYQFRGLDTSTAAPAQSNSVFLTISRKFPLLR